MAIYEMQGGRKPARNYLGKQKTVSNVPIKWKSGPDAPETELAYITKAEKDLLIKTDLHGSLKNGPNTGPDDIMSLDSQGDYTRDRSPGAYSGGASSQGGGSPAQQSKGVGTSQQALRDRAMNEAHMKAILTGQKDIGQTTQTGKLTRRYSDLPEWMNVKQADGTYKRKHMASAYKDTGQRGFLSNLFSRGARGYRGIKGLPAWGDAQKNYAFQEEGPQGPGYYTDMEDFGEVRDAFPNFGILGILNALGKRFKKPPVDMSQFNTLGAAQTGTASDVPMARLDPWSTPINNQIVPLAKPTNNVFNYKDQVQSMTDFSPKNFNVNQNYGTALNKPHFNYPMGANQNWIGNTMTNPNEATQGINLNNTSGIVPNYGAGNPRLPKRMADGGRIGYNRGRVVNPGGYAGEEDFEELEDENIYEFMQDQGVPFSEMAEGMSPFDMRVQELVDEGMSWQEAYQIASEEFGQIAEGEDTFSSEGIASLA